MTYKNKINSSLISKEKLDLIEMDHVRLCDYFRYFCGIGDLDSIEFVLNNRITKNKLFLNNSEFNEDPNNAQIPLKTACGHNQVEVVKYLLFGDYPGERVDVNAIKDIGFRSALSNGSIEVLDLLLTDKRITKKPNMHAFNDDGFINAYENNEFKILKHIILNYNFKITKTIKKYIETLESKNDFNLGIMIESFFLEKNLKVNTKKDIKIKKI